MMSSTHSPNHFLLVENDPQEAAVLSRAFEAIPDCGTVAVARNISEAKAYLKGAGVYADRRKYKLPCTILSSFRVDGDSGVELLAWVRTEASLQKIPFVLLTPASVSRDEVERAQSAGEVKVAKKPASSVELKHMLEHLAQTMCSDAAQACHTELREERSPSIQSKRR